MTCDVSLSRDKTYSPTFVIGTVLLLTHTMIARSVLLVLIAVGTALACGPPGTTLGGFCPIDANDPLVQEMAQFAVSTHASRTNAVNDGSISVDHAWSQVRNFSHELLIEQKSILNHFKDIETHDLFIMFQFVLYQVVSGFNYKMTITTRFNGQVLCTSIRTLFFKFNSTIFRSYLIIICIPFISQHYLYFLFWC